MWMGLQCLLLAYVPGAAVFRLPIGDRDRRAALAAEERLFWAVMLSVLCSAFVTLGLAMLGRYTVTRVLGVNAGLAGVSLLLCRQHLRLPASAPRPTWTALLPLALAGGALWLNFLVPPAEYIMGGRDPGVYMTEGIRIAQRGSLITTDEVVRTLPAVYRDLYFPRTTERTYYSNRFMGYFLLDPAAGVSVGQFPHGYPVLVALGYSVNGLTGARAISGLCGALGIVALYMAGSRLFGRAAGLAGAALLAAHVAQLWYSRYPNAEIFLQPLVFGGLLAYVRAVHDRIRFFAPIAALLFVLGAFTHLTGIIVAGCVMAGAAADALARGRKVSLGFWVPIGAGTLASVVYLAHYIPAYFARPQAYVNDLGLALRLASVAGAVLALAALRALRRVPGKTLDAGFAVGLVGAVSVLAAYAYFFRVAGGTLAPHDADSLRTFTTFYLSPAALAVALAGFALATFAVSEAAVFVLLVGAFSIVFFRKIQIVPEHFWAARRFLAVILPGILLLAGAAAFAPFGPPTGSAPAWWQTSRARLARGVVGAVLLALLGARLLRSTEPLLRHVEYAGLIPQLEQLASTFGDDDLVVVESRNASDTHVLALPLAYVYARNVLVLASPAPPKDAVRGFLTWARSRYKRIFFVGGGGGGTELLSRSISVAPILGERFQIPEYEPAYNAYPRGPLRKEFDLSVYEFLPEATATDAFVLDVGEADDLYVRRFYAKERDSGGHSVRWTRDISFVSAVGLRSSDRTVTLWMGTGGRPDTVAPATVAVSLAKHSLGSVTVKPGLQPYVFDIPPDLAGALAQDEAAAVLQLDTHTWSPSRFGGGDTRELGVLLDRVEIR